MHAFDGRTDGETDGILIARPRLHSMQRGKNDRYDTIADKISRYDTIRSASASPIHAERTAQRHPVSTRQNAAAPSGRAFQHYTAGVKHDFQQHTTQHM